MNKILIILAISLLTACSKPNSKPSYGDTGLPKNCRAIIKANIEEYRKIRASQEDYSVQMDEIDGLFSSMDRNCGENGYSWEYE
ncbi:hypothetical protein B9X73_03935 [Acinetobacter baumannii]|uniref:hypothetical protein n=1 Tax=Acinetobacter baumannii TaxID=470 RepID=UPI0004F57995|nr:hypothetical protein [Acinetobacter baumannii]KRI88272.1 hypothetical protein APC70_19265 [Acinetobacter baumannii]MCA4275575.1 kynureninase [Acinetobacter baumannii]MCT9450897.1 kynureninase [Acinetobacter baumannii]MDC4790808.1 kynureninase [Acinetobacter baumannii]MDC5109817.1 kynureninase [Acinetobacter baumannii]